MTRWILVPLLVLALAAVSAAQKPPADEWKFDILHLRNGRVIQGLLIEETPTLIRFECVRRNPGRSTVVFTTTFKRIEIERIQGLSPADRDLLSTRLRALDRTGQGEKQRMEDLEIRPAPWGKDGKDGLSYSSDHFVLHSNAPEEIVRRSAVRLEQIYAAYTRFLPPRRQAAAPTTILLVESVAEYQGIIRGQGRNILNPAFYDPGRNQVVCASELRQLGEDLARARRQHQQLIAELREKEADLVRLYRTKDRIPPAFLQPIREARLKIAQAQDSNDKVFEAATRRLFQTLYHEAFHAYLANYVYSPAETEVPRWLNEGLAQIFETALVEGDELRVGHAEASRAKAVRAALEKGEWVSTLDLLKASPQQFLVAHAEERGVSDRHYLASWALAFHLTFDRRLLGTARLDEYVRALKRDADIVQAFQELVGQPLPEFEKGLRQYLAGLKEDGTTVKNGSGK